MSTGERILEGMDLFSKKAGGVKKNQHWLAENLGVSKSLVSSWIRNKRKPDLDQIESLSRILKCCPSWLAFNKPVRHFPEEYTEIRRAARRNHCVFAWYARATKFHFNWEPVYNRPETDAVLTTAEDTWDVRIEETSAVRDRSIIEEWLEPASFSTSLVGPQDMILRVRMPPKHFNGWVVAATSLEHPRGIEYRFLTFHSNVLKNYGVTLGDGEYYFVLSTGTPISPDRYLLPPRGRGLKTVQEMTYEEFVAMEPYLDKASKDVRLKTYNWPSERTGQR